LEEKMSIKKERIKVYDMTCTSCERRIKRELMKLPGVYEANASFSAQEVVVRYNSDLCDTEKIKECIKSSGYSLESTKGYRFAGILIIAAAIILLGGSTAGFDMNEKLKGASYLMLFIVGVLTSLHCVGMCGGIMVSQSISKDDTTRLKAMMPAAQYNAGRVVSYTVIGGIVGALGSAISLSLGVKAGIQIFAGVFMIIMGLNMAGFSIFRKFSIKLPWSSCSIKRKPKSPFLVGILNGLMPCGPLQTMQLYALGTGSAIAGASSMFIFSLGTVPLMLTFGALTGLLSKGYTKKILKFSGYMVIILGLIMGSRGLSLAGFGVPSLNSALAAGTGSSNGQANIGKAVMKDGYQEIVMTADGSGYTPNAFYVKKGVPVKWIIKGNALNSCNNGIVVTSLNIEKTLKAGDNIIEFTPQDNKDINFSCWMGMIRGVIKVTDNLDTVDTTKADSSIPAPSSGMPCCTGNAATGTNATTSATATVAQKPSIYGSNLSVVPTSRLVRKAEVTGSSQSISVKGIGYELEPMVLVMENNLNTKLTVDLNSFDNPYGKYEVIELTTNKTVVTFTGVRGSVSATFKLPDQGTYMIIKDNSLLGVIEGVYDINSANLESIRAKYVN
jgi:sulfite exporter TauE/SafE/plastocyanin domain-containing protein/copper chaperone CopZ